MQNSTICTIHQASFNVSKMYLGVDSQLNYILGWTFILLVIEQLPVELRDRFTDMREMDLQVQSKFDVQLCCPFLYVQYYVLENSSKKARALIRWRSCLYNSMETQN